MIECTHKNKEYAGTLYEGIIDGQYIRDVEVKSNFKIYCKDCGHYINLLTNRIIGDEGLIHRVD